MKKPSSKKRPPLTNIEGECRELTAEDFAAATVHMPKEPISIRLDPDVLAFFRAGGKGYQTRMGEVLGDYAKAQRRK